MCSITPPPTTYKRLALLDAHTQRRLAACGASSVYVDDAHSPTGRRVVFTQSCSLSVCLRCAERRDRERQSIITTNMSRIMRQYSGQVFYSLTVTNPLVCDDEIRRLTLRTNRILGNMTRTKAAKKLGFSGLFRAIEVKKIAPEKINLHTHVLLSFDPECGFNSGELDELCGRYFGTQYDLRPVTTNDRYASIGAAVSAFARYMGKGFASVARGHLTPFFQQMATVLRGLRRYAGSGIFRDILKRPDTKKTTVQDGEKIYLKSKKSGRIIEAFYDSARGFFGSFGIGRPRKKQTPPEPPPQPPPTPITDPNNRVAAALAAFDAQTAAHVARAAASNAPYRPTG